MAFGIDDALTLAASGVSLTDTIVQTIARYRKNNKDIDLERLLEEVKVTALQRIDEADLALSQFERMLIEKNVNLDRMLADIIAGTPFWHPFEQHRLSQIRKSFHAFSDSVYGATDDIAALVRCHDNTGDMGVSVVESAETKHQLLSNIVNASSLKEAIDRLRFELKRQKQILTSV